MTTSPPLRPNIFAYHHYRTFLKDWFEHRKEAEEDFSLRRLARDAKLSSAYLPYVLAGERNLSTKALTKLLPFLGLSRKEEQYLSLLVELGGATTQQARVHVMDRLRRFRTFQQTNPNENRVFHYLTRWFNVAIREMATLPNFKLDPAWIKERLGGNVSLGEIRASLEFLKSEGFLKADEHGRVTPPRQNIRCEGSVFGLALRQFSKEMNNVLFEALDETPDKEHVVAGHTFTIHREKFPLVRSILEEALKKIEALKHGGADADVYHVTLVSAPVTKRSRTTKVRN